MSMKNENLAYFKDGHVEKITSFEFIDDNSIVWFTTDSGRSFIHKERPDKCKFYEAKITEELGPHYSVTDEIEKIKICSTR